MTDITCHTYRFKVVLDNTYSARYRRGLELLLKFYGSMDILVEIALMIAAWAVPFDEVLNHREQVSRLEHSVGDTMYDSIDELTEELKDEGRHGEDVFDEMMCALFALALDLWGVIECFFDQFAQAGLEEDDCIDVFYEYSWHLDYEQAEYIEIRASHEQ